MFLDPPKRLKYKEEAHLGVQIRVVHQRSVKMIPIQSIKMKKRLNRDSLVK